MINTRKEYICKKGKYEAIHGDKSSQAITNTSTQLVKGISPKTMGTQPMKGKLIVTCSKSTYPYKLIHVCWPTHGASNTPTS